MSDYLEYEKARVYIQNNMMPQIRNMTNALQELVKATADHGSKISDGVTESAKGLINKMAEELNGLCEYMTYNFENTKERFQKIKEIEEIISKIIEGIR